jgi:hypothetical protein
MTFTDFRAGRGVATPMFAAANRNLSIPGSGALYQVERRELRQAPEPKPDRPVIRSPLRDKRAGPSPWLARSLTRSGARSRLEAELRAIAVDLLGRCQPGELPNDCAEWLATTVEAAVTRVCDSSLASLADALDSHLDDAPPWIAQRLHEAEVRHDAGYV